MIHEGDKYNKYHGSDMCNLWNVISGAVKTR